ncbi:APC family permease [Bacillus sp. 03113]|uniref:APC family permease n=1 Tax=Bacillus sp. 03113 TaxID=2578211 RepID=UPI00114142EC|nr:APC family permease [Bacillus sp. 03113]
MENSVTLKRSIGLWSVVVLGLGYLTPAVVFDTFGIVSGDTDGHVPTAYIIALVAMLFTAYSYGKMVRVFPTAGSAYTYAHRTMSPEIGFFVGWLSLLDYLLLPMVNVLLGKIYLVAIFPEVPTWIWVVLLVLLITVVNAMSLNSTANLNTLFVIYQMLIIVFFIILAIRELNGGMGYGEVFTPAPFFSGDMQLSSLITGATVLCFSFLGFDAVTTYSEETENPKKTIPKAIFLTAIIGGVIFIVASYFTQALYPHVDAFKDPDATAPEIALYLGGKFFQILFLSSSFAGVIASGLASHASVSRLMYVMGRDGVFSKKYFGYVHPKLRTPLFNIVIVGVISLSAIFFNLETAAAFINFGSLIAFSFVNLSVIAHYAFREKKVKTAKEVFFNVILPLIGFSFMFILWLNIQRTSFMLGLGWAAVGAVYLLVIKKIFKVNIKGVSIEEPSMAVSQDAKPV